MLKTFKPASAAEAREIIAWAAAGGETLEIIGGGSKRGLGRPAEARNLLDVSRLAGIIDYDPAELVLTAQGATPLGEVAALLEAQGQMLAFEPPDWGTLLGGGSPTLGGTIACNMAGPRRIRAGAARDHFLGFSAINGRGEIWKAGGRVVKNVTGYDMCKLQAGAFGTLSVLLELSLKVLPRPETSTSLMLTGLDDATAARQMARALNTQHEVSGAAHLPAAIARHLGHDAAVTVLRIEGPKPSVAERAARLATEFAGGQFLDAAESAGLWSRIAGVASLLPDAASIVWRICTAPSEAHKVFAAVQKLLAGATGFYDWGGGQLWLAVDAATPEGGAAPIRAAVAQAGGTATLIRAPVAMRRGVPVFTPLPAAHAALARRVKLSFDPLGILNPGRMQEGS